jgi:hypothetical protein
MGLVFEGGCTCGQVRLPPDIHTFTASARG